MEQKKPLMNSGDVPANQKAQFERLEDGPDAEDQGKVAFMPEQPGQGDYIGLTKEELEQYANDPTWRTIRMVMFVLFWLLWIAMFAAAIGIVIAAPKCPDIPVRHWWQRKVGYSIVPQYFKDTDGDGVGDLDGIKSSLKQLKRLNVQTIWIQLAALNELQAWAGLGMGDTRPDEAAYPYWAGGNRYDCSKLYEIKGSTTSDEERWQDFEGLIKAIHKEKMYAMVDFIVPTFGGSDDNERHWTKAKSCIEKHIKMGVDGFYLFQYMDPVLSGGGTQKLVDRIKSLNDTITKVKLENNIDREILLTTSQYGGKGFEAWPESDLQALVSENHDDVQAAGLNMVYNSHLPSLGADTLDQIYDTISETHTIFSTFNDTWPAWQLTDVSGKRATSRFGNNSKTTSRDGAELATMMTLMLPGSVNNVFGEELTMFDRELNPASKDITEKLCRTCSSMLWNSDKTKNYGFTNAGGVGEPVDLQGTKPIFFNPAMSQRSSPVRLFRRIAGLRNTDYAFLYGNFKLGSKETTQKDKVITLMRYPGVIKANNFIFTGNFDWTSEHSVNLVKELDLDKDAKGIALAMTTNMVNRNAFRIRGGVDLTKVVLKPAEGILIKLKS